MLTIRITLLFLFINSITVLSFDKDSIGVRIDINSNKFKYILETIFLNYADTVDIDLISEEAFRTMLNKLDRYSAYLDKDQLYNKQVSNVGSEIGIGVELGYFGDTAVVYKVVDKSPADSSGIEPFDKILAINDVNVIGKSLVLIYQRLRGQRNSIVNLQVESRFTKKIREVQLTRREVPISSLYISMVLPGTETGYINSKKFSKISHEEFSVVLDELVNEGMKNLIIDLRDNPGGFLEQVGLIVNEFLPDGNTISYTKARNPIFSQRMESSAKCCCKELPLVMILNQNSASACELFAGAIQDLDRGLVVGQRSFGKSSAQQLWKMNDSTGFQMTVAEYFTPLGRSINIKENDSVFLDPAMKLTVGDTTYNQIVEVINKFGGETKLPVFHSLKGRTLLGGGGIFPDYMVEEEKNTLLMDIFLQRYIIFEYVHNFLTDNYAILKSEFNNMDSFVIKFRIPDKMLFDLKSLSYSKKIWNEEMFLKDKSAIRNHIKAEIARVLFGNRAYYAVLIRNDNYIEKALEVMQESGSLIQN
ncbi:S41 family peptidase [Bacteroidota bacterium]